MLLIKADMLDENGKLPRIREALLADAIATSAGAVLGTSTTTTFVESSSGVAEGGRTGLASVVTGALFVACYSSFTYIYCNPWFCNSSGAYICRIPYDKRMLLRLTLKILQKSIPAYLCLVAMPLTYSISEGIAVGVISYVLINLISGKAKEKKISVLMYVLAILFILKYIFL